MEREPDLIFVKEETYDDHPIGQQMRLTDNRKGRYINKKNPKIIIPSFCDFTTFVPI